MTVLTLVAIMRKQIRAIKIGILRLFGAPHEARRSVALVARYLWNVQVRRKELVILLRLGGIGDLACVLGCVQGLRTRHPNSWMVIISPRGCSELAASSGLPDAAADRGSFFHGFINWLRPRASFYHPMLPDENDPPRPQTLHLADEFARVLGVLADLSSVTFRVPARARRRLTDRLVNVNPWRHPVIVFHPGPTWPVREWPAQNWCELAERIFQSTSAIMIKIGTDVDSLGRVRPFAPIPNVVDWTNQLDILETAALLELASVFVGIDSGPLHIAGILGVPAVGLFGPVFGHLRLHPHAQATIVSSSPHCLGCHHTPTGQLHWRTGCPHHIICMREIEATDVFTAVMRYIGNRDCATVPNFLGGGALTPTASSNYVAKPSSMTNDYEDESKSNSFHRASS